MLTRRRRGEAENQRYHKANTHVKAFVRRDQVNHSGSASGSGASDTPGARWHKRQRANVLDLSRQPAAVKVKHGTCDVVMARALCPSACLPAYLSACLSVCVCVRACVRVCIVCVFG
jgi:hypothetical protein